MNSRTRLCAVLVLWVVASSAGTALAQVDAGAAQALAKRNDCFKCHTVDRAKKGPAYRAVAGRLKSKPDAVEVLIEHLTTGHMVEVDEGVYENHRIVETQDQAELLNLVRWILSLSPTAGNINSATRRGPD